MLNRVVELSNNRRDIEIDQVNGQVKRLNALIDKYNRAQPTAKRELLLEVYYAHRLLDAKMQGVTLMHTDKIEEYSEKLHEVFVDELKAEFRQINIQPFHESVINAWDIQNIKSDEGIPSPVRFAKMTRPGYWARLIGETHSVAVQTVMRLMADISQSSLKENTKENYHKLSTLKASIREILSDSTLSTDDQAVLRGLILTLNGRIADILENNPVLQREIEPPVFPFADSVGNASYEDLLEMTTALVDRNNFTPQAFHLAFDDMFPGLADYTVTYLGGANAKNYLLADPVTQQQFVLKVSPEMGSNRQTAERLKNTAVSNNLAHVYASRDRLLTDINGVTKHYSLEITEYCARGDVLAYGATMATPEEKLASAYSIYSQMTDTLMHFGSNNALFPDMKPVNFLVTEDGKLIIADTKSFLETSNGVFRRDTINETQFYMYTPGIEPPELDTIPTTQVDKHHAYLMGLSLFLYLTAQESPHF